MVVCNRRGHGTLPLTAPRFSTIGSTDDLRAQLDQIRRRLPRSPLYGLGVSAGTALLVRYLGEEVIALPLRPPSPIARATTPRAPSTACIAAMIAI